LEFYVGNVIPGWNEVLPMLGEGGRGIFVIPANKAYGEEGFGALISPGQHLIFDIRLLKILEKEKE
jgi:FKBP-type peptidyl-prolyl cis-trans isomerase